MGFRFLLEAQRCWAKGFFFLEKGPLVSGAETNTGARGANGVISDGLKRLAKVDSLGLKVMPGGGGTSSAGLGVGSGSAKPSSSSCWASAGSGWESTVFPCRSPSQAEA